MQNASEVSENRTEISENTQGSSEIENEDQSVNEKNSPAEISKDKIIFEIKQILDSQPPEAKKLSDQKLSDMLSERGIKVARRTIAKYRSQIGVKSSYDR